MRLFFILSIFFIFLSCKSDIEPVVYDKSIDLVEKEAQIIRLLISNASYIEARKDLDKNLKLYPENSQLMLLKGYLFLQEKRYSESEEVFLGLLSKDSKNPLAYLGLAQIYRLSGKFSLAKSNIQTGLSYSKFNSHLWLESGMIDYEENKIKEALVKFIRASNLDIKNNEANFFKYLCMLREGREIDEIKSVWQNIIKSGKFKVYYFLYHADALYKMDYKDFSLSVVKEGLIFFPTDPYLLNFHAYLVYENVLKTKEDDDNKAKNISLALDDIKKCISYSDEPCVEFIDTYFLILDILNDSDTLKKELNNYIYKFPDSDIMKKWTKKIFNE